MQRTSFEDMNCSVAQCLEVVGEWWSLLIVRDAFLGVRRFDDFQARLGISRNILNQRLTKLVDNGVLDRVPYQDNPPRRTIGSPRKAATSGSSSPRCASGGIDGPPRRTAAEDAPRNVRAHRESRADVLALRRTARSSFGDLRAWARRGRRRPRAPRALTGFRARRALRMKSPSYTRPEWRCPITTIVT